MIRRATLEDLQAIRELNLNLFKHEVQFSDSYSLEWRFSQAGQDYFTKRITADNGVVFVFQVKGKVVGYICGFTYIYPARKEPLMAEIDNMYIEDTHRRKKIGTELIRVFEAHAKLKGVKRLKVSALFKNMPAHEFYKKCGFTEHEIVFEKKL